jgi:hypothetical protein
MVYIELDEKIFKGEKITLVTTSATLILIHVELGARKRTKTQHNSSCHGRQRQPG